MKQKRHRKFHQKWTTCRTDYGCTIYPVQNLAIVKDVLRGYEVTRIVIPYGQFEERKSISVTSFLGTVSNEASTKQVISSSNNIHTVTTKTPNANFSVLFHKQMHI